MDIIIIGIAAGTLTSMAAVICYLLGWANQVLYVEVDPKVELVIEALPGANCGGCGYIGCAEYAKAVACNETTVDKCTVGGKSCAQALANIMGVTLGKSLPYRPIVHCGSHWNDRLQRNEYKGVRRCPTANLVAGVQGCTYGCLGFGECARACKFDAMHVIDGLATVDYEKCVGCGACAKVCPRNIISLSPFKARQMLAVTCSNHDKGKDVKDVCKVGCLGCKACTRVSDLFKVVDHLSTLDYDAYTPDRLDELISASKRCPRQRLVFVGKPTPKDLDAVADQLLPEVITPDFKTTVDETEWWG